jgi:CYTH domain-containing protein
MAIEIERKFLVRDDTWQSAADPGQLLCQGYIAHGQDSSVRVRLAGERAFLTIKGTHAGLSRPEFEYEIPVTEAQDMLRMFCPQPLLTKTRYRVPHEGMVWEIDVFSGHATGLVLAEVELTHADQAIAIPRWAGREVTDDPRYRNSSIVNDPPLEPAEAG